MREVSLSCHWVDAREVRQVAQRVHLGGAVQISVVDDDKAIFAFLFNPWLRLCLTGALALLVLILFMPINRLKIVSRNENL